MPTRGGGDSSSLHRRHGSHHGIYPPHQAWIAVALLCGVGVAGGLALSLIVADVQASAADAVRGRVVSVYTIISQVVPAASGVAAGALVQRFGVSAALYVCGATLVAAMLFNALWMTALRQHRG